MVREKHVVEAPAFKDAGDVLIELRAQEIQTVERMAPLRMAVRELRRDHEAGKV
jgi:hypothetical protein